MSVEPFVSSGSSTRSSKGSTSETGPSTWHSRLGFGGEDNGEKPLRRWAAISLIALPTVALLVPGYRVYRMSRTAKVVSTSTPPPVRAGKLGHPVAPQSSQIHARNLTSTLHPPPRRNLTPVDSPPPPRATSQIALPSSSALAAKSQTTAKQKTSMNEEGGEVDAAALEAAKDPLYAAGAFGIATLLVGLGLFGGVWTTRRVLGVDNIDEFAARMRSLIRRHIPQLSDALYKTDERGLLDTNLRPKGLTEEAILQWDANASEVRLREAFDRGGVEAWAECALREMEAERRITVEAARHRT
ncbi:hypothetical protein SCHPADRAFT_928473 [Schizopora paradoxa]|uniref:Uncharacterized protein n=1 Tax=Schizopora paradoxa TaxID=27342 RepID=A0A0H2RPK5_9AGAM|nr:hypothetical protein SCHPADRAFT_928473 [Schizopora paradoxa]